MVLLGCDVSEFLAKLDPSTVPPEEAAKPKPVKKAAARKASKK
jgi:hypothetical protein